MYDFESLGRFDLPKKLSKLINNNILLIKILREQKESKLLKR